MRRGQGDSWAVEVFWLKVWRGRWVVSAGIGVVGAAPLAGVVSVLAGWPVSSGVGTFGMLAACVVVSMLFARLCLSFIRVFFESERRLVRALIAAMPLFAFASSWLGKLVWDSTHYGWWVRVDWFVASGLLVCAVVFAWDASRLRAWAGWRCAGCGYERAKKRTVKTWVCPECGNAWWDDARVVSRLGKPWHVLRPLSGGVRVRVPAEQGWTKVMLLQVVAFAPVVLYFALTSLGLIAARLPDGVVVWLAPRESFMHNGEFVEQVFTRGSIDRSEREALLAELIERRDRGWEWSFRTPTAVQDAMAIGLIGEEAFEAYVDSSFAIDPRLRSSEGRGVEVYLYAERVETWDAGVGVLPIGVRMNGVSMEPGRTGPGSFSSPLFLVLVAGDWAEVAHLGGPVERTRAEFEAESRASRWSGRQTSKPGWWVEVPIEASAGDVVEVEVDLWVEAMPRGVTRGQHQYFTASGEFVEPASPVWGERRTVRALVEVPGSGG